MQLTPPDVDSIQADVSRALAEDIGSGDITAEILPANKAGRAQVITRESAVIAGIAWFDACFHALDPTIVIDWHVRDGDRIETNTTLCSLHGSVRALLSAERCALNFLQTLSATATLTSHYVNAIRGTRATILDTRKTLPGLRLAQKYAVRCGGGANHRIGLFDAILIKENHIAAAGSITAAVAIAKQFYPKVFLEVEVESVSQLREAVELGVDRIMLDNFSLAEMKIAVKDVAGHVPLEASGGVDLNHVHAIAETGVNFISVGALTKNIQAIDLSMRINL